METCGFCYPREHGKNGEVIREWSKDWNMFISVCRRHSFETTATDKAFAAGFRNAIDDVLGPE